MRVNGRCGAKPRASSQLRTSRLGVGEIDEERAVERSERARQQRAGDRVVLGDQRAELRRHAAVAAEQEARDAAVALGDELGRRQAPAQARQHAAAVGAERRGVVGGRAPASPHRSIGRMVTPSGADDARRLRRCRAARQPVEAPGILEAERAIDRAAVRRRVEHRHEAAAARSSIARRISRVAKPAAAIARPRPAPC